MIRSISFMQFLKNIDYSYKVQNYRELEVNSNLKAHNFVEKKNIFNLINVNHMQERGF